MAVVLQKNGIATESFRDRQTARKGFGKILEQFLFFRGRIFLKKRLKNQETAATC